MQILLNILIVLLVIAVIAVAALYFFGRRLESQQASQQQMLEASKQTVSIIVIDKKRLKLKDSGLPQIVLDQTPWYGRIAKLPIVKAKVGPRFMNLVADEKVFVQLPLNREAKCEISGIYITGIKSVRGGMLPLPAKKKGLRARLYDISANFHKKNK